jgi:SAM-dependent methyltransferase
MVDLIAKTTADLPWVEAAQVDAAAIDLPDGSYDAVVFRMGLMFLPEPRQGLAEIHRVLAPRGRLAAATWAGPQHNPWLTTAGMALMMQGLLSGDGPTAPGTPMSLGELERLEALAKEVGFGSVSVGEVDLVARFSDADAYLGHVGEMAPPFKAALQAATEEQVSAVRATIVSGLERFATADGLVIPAKALCLQATR